MSTRDANHNLPAGEPALVIPALAPFYAWVRDLSYPLIRLTVGEFCWFTASSS
jgi:hypothetical protein